MAKIDSNFKWLTYEEMAKNVADRALDEVLYDGKSIREWMQIIVSEDCISRTDAINAMSNAIKRVFPEHRDIAEKTMNKLPPVTPQQPKMGRWIYRKEEDLYRCSLCTFPCHKDNMGALPTRYCAECGAIMQEVEE